MPIYRYRAKKSAEELVEEKIEAKSKKEAVEKISAMGYFPLSIEEDAALPKASPPVSKIFPSRIKSSDITLFSRQLATLIKSGVPILNALNIISEQSSNAAFRGLLNNIYDKIKNGSNLSSVLAGYPRLFSPIYIALVGAGEESGNLPAVLWKIADYRRKQEEIFSRVRVALAYPVFMLLVGIGTVIFMLTFVMPRLMGIFSSLGQSLPLPTQILIAVSAFLRRRGIAAALLIFIFYLFIRRRLRSKSAKYALSIFQLKLPVLRGIILKSEIARLTRTLELLIRTGIPILRAIEVSVPILGNELLKQQLTRSYKELEQGGSLGKSLKNSKLFPLFMSNLIIVGEQSGKLDDALAEVADSYERDIDEAIKVMTSLLEPLMILVMGLAVGFIVVAMLLPLFQINVMVR